MTVSGTWDPSYPCIGKRDPPGLTSLLRGYIAVPLGGPHGVRLGPIINYNFHRTPPSADLAREDHRLPNRVHTGEEWALMSMQRANPPCTGNVRDSELIFGHAGPHFRFQRARASRGRDLT